MQKYVLAFGVLQKGKKIVIGRDSRVSGRWIMPYVQGLLASLGYDVVDLGIVPTPTVQYVTMHLKADGGLIVTSSHNPAEWNGMHLLLLRAHY